MKRLICALVLSGVWSATSASQAADGPPPTFAVHGPTIAAFFAPVTRSDLDNDPDTNEALSDFQYYAGLVGAPLRKAGIDFREADARSFRIRNGSRLRTFRIGKIGVGYYFVAPGRKPQIEYGVMTDSDLLDKARKYFGIPIE
jgi:hypothetical protein